MPFLNDAVPLPLSPEPPERPFHELFDVAFRRENTIGSISEAMSWPPAAPPDPSYDPFQDIGGYENDASAFISANNPEDVARVKMRLTDERRRKQELEDGGARGLLAHFVAGVLDPVNLLPVGGQIYAATRAGRIALGALRAGATGAVSQTAAETVLQNTQLDRSLDESARNVAFAAGAGAGLGAIAVAARTFIGSPIGGLVGLFGPDDSDGDEDAAGEDEDAAGDGQDEGAAETTEQILKRIGVRTLEQVEAEEAEEDDDDDDLLDIDDYFDDFDDDE